MKFTAKTLFGLEGILADELVSLGARNVQPANRAVLFEGSKELMYLVNYRSFLTISVLRVVNDFNIKSKDDLYRYATETEWERFMGVDNTFAVTTAVNSDIFDHSGYPGLVVKDAIADRFRNISGKRPSVDTTDPDLVINLHISQNRATLSLDSSGVPLYRRGYRKVQGTAPLNEVLAAGIIRLSGWNPSLPLIDPMCGSGTILIEAGLMAAGIAPGSFRSSFGFMRWNDFDELLYKKVISESTDTIQNAEFDISGYDISEIAVEHALINIENAGLAEKIKVLQTDFRELKGKDKTGFIIMNPPYGERLISADIEEIYKMTGSVLKHNFPGNKAFIITTTKEHLNNVGLKPSVKHNLYNGQLECILAGYDLFSGPRRVFASQKSN